MKNFLKLDLVYGKSVIVVDADSIVAMIPYEHKTTVCLADGKEYNVQQFVEQIVDAMQNNSRITQVKFPE